MASRPTRMAPKEMVLLSFATQRFIVQLLVESSPGRHFAIPYERAEPVYPRRLVWLSFLTACMSALGVYFVWKRRTKLFHYYVWNLWLIFVPLSLLMFIQLCTTLHQPEALTTECMLYLDHIAPEAKIEMRETYLETMCSVSIQQTATPSLVAGALLLSWSLYGAVCSLAYSYLIVETNNARPSDIQIITLEI